MRIVCPKLVHFDIDSRDAVSAAFADAPALRMQQGWLDKPDVAFLPGRVRIGWRDDFFLLFGEMTHDRLTTSAIEDNQLLCNLGDVFEIFLQDPGCERYLELHVAPNGKRLQLLWPDAASIRLVGNRELSLDGFKVHPLIFDFSQWSEGNTWCICASVPSSAFLPFGTSLESRIWKASFCRYDYSSAEKTPILSSTSPHTERCFHRQQEWTEVLFEA